MKKLVLIFCCLLSAAAFAQDAVVVELSKSDADQAKQLYAAKQAADKAWDDHYKTIIGKYRDFSNGADFSKDFRFIVPKTGGTTLTSCCYSTYWSWGTGCPITVTPATGSGFLTPSNTFTLPSTWSSTPATGTITAQ
jgi:hypothetical protein